MSEHGLRLVRSDAGETEDRVIDARLAQGNSLFDQCHTKPGCARRFEFARAFDSSVAICVGLDDGHDFDRLADMALHGAEVVT